MYNNGESDKQIEKFISNLNSKRLLIDTLLGVIQRIENRLSILEKKFSILEHRICDDDLK